MRSAGWLLLMGLLMVNCAAPDRLGNLDLVRWRNDRGGCGGVRATQINDFKASRESLLGQTVNDAGKLLGRPDVEQLDDRNQKYYIYYLEKGPHCQEAKAKSNSRSVALRISAIGLVTEITFQRGKP